MRVCAERLELAFELSQRVGQLLPARVMRRGLQLSAQLGISQAQ